MNNITYKRKAKPVEDEEAKKMTVKEIIDKLWYKIEIVD